MAQTAFFKAILKKYKKKTKRCLAWQLDEVRGATRYNTIQLHVLQKTLY